MNISFNTEQLWNLFCICSVILLFTYLIVNIAALYKKRISAGAFLARLFILCFLSYVLWSTVYGRPVYNRRHYKPLLFWSWKESFEGDLDLFIQIVLNILMLMPLGFLLPLGYGSFSKTQDSNFSISYKGIKAGQVLVTGIAISLFIELNQLLWCRGLFEFDDVLHNSLGCVVGYYWCRYLLPRFISKTHF